MNRVRVGITEDARRQGMIGAALLGAVLLVISLFLNWYSIGLTDQAKTGIGQLRQLAEASGQAVPDISIPSAGYSGWGSLEFADAFLLFAAIAAVLMAVSRLRGRAEGSGLFPLGALTVVLMLVTLFTKSAFIGGIDSTLSYVNDQISAVAGQFSDELAAQGVPGGALEVPIEVSTGIGVYLALIGSLLLLLAGFLDSVVEATGARAGAATAGAGAAPAAAAPPAGETEIAPTQPGEEGLPPAGWYEDPHRQAAERYWDGSQWTTQTR